MPDPNGTFATAESLTLGVANTGRVGYAESGYFDSADYFRFVATASGTVTFRLTGLAADIDIALFNSGQSRVASSLKAGTAEELIQFNVTAGQTYYVEVFPGVSGAASSYTLNSSFQPAVQLSSVTIAGAPVANEGGQLVYTVSRAGGSNAQALTVFYSLGGSATSGQDYAAPSGSMTIAAGSSFGSLVINTIADQIDDPGTTETVLVTLSSSSGYTLGAAKQATGTINDTSVPPLQSVTIAGAPVSNEGGQLVYTVRAWCKITASS